MSLFLIMMGGMCTCLQSFERVENNQLTGCMLQEELK